MPIRFDRCLWGALLTVADSSGRPRYVLTALEISSDRCARERTCGGNFVNPSLHPLFVMNAPPFLSCLFPSFVELASLSSCKVASLPYPDSMLWEKVQGARTRREQRRRWKVVDDRAACPRKKEGANTRGEERRGDEGAEYKVAVDSARCSRELRGARQIDGSTCVFDEASSVMSPKRLAKSTKSWS
ncbi:hypothetical protein IE81DRAFT_13564 [Ceraceosorus guamensis]|uniref:Uncharacterized protein n=1 Tax=Ceraceosorus guamensis TaxID=1522189 RepID=A0A316VTW4_9BASI|nr:hypothetical protein IE81DRAFT_13564 [Ceraceosorus guamensis]PWN39671.1 hypothetical protein IE81DRAFT_13564 [Ceraceosorus guamensis]